MANEDKPIMSPEERKSLLKDFEDLEAYLKAARKDLAKVSDAALLLHEARAKAETVQTMACNTYSKVHLLRERLRDSEEETEGVQLVRVVESRGLHY
jgi:hypothetical protein